MTEDLEIVPQKKEMMIIIDIDTDKIKTILSDIAMGVLGAFATIIILWVIVSIFDVLGAEYLDMGRYNFIEMMLDNIR